MGIYEETYEKIAYRVKQGDEKKSKTTLIPEGVDDDDALVRHVAFRKTPMAIGLLKKTKHGFVESPSPVILRLFIFETLMQGFLNNIGS